MKKAIACVFLGLVLLVIFILVTAPAKTVIPFIKKTLPRSVSGVQLGQITGSLWAPKIKGVHYKKLKLEQLSLNINPLSLLIGNFQSELQISDPQLSVEGHILANKKAIRLSDTQIALSAKQLNPYMTFPVNGLFGEINTDVKQLEINSSLRIKKLLSYGSWEDASIHYLDQQLSLGNFNFKAFTDAENNITVDIIDNDGVLDLKGSLKLSQNKNYTLNLSTQENIPNNLKVWINRLGHLENNRYKIIWNGKL